MDRPNDEYTVNEVGLNSEIGVFRLQAENKAPITGKGTLVWWTLFTRQWGNGKCFSSSPIFPSPNGWPRINVSRPLNFPVESAPVVKVDTTTTTVTTHTASETPVVRQRRTITTSTTEGQTTSSPTPVTSVKTLSNDSCSFDVSIRPGENGKTGNRCVINYFLLNSFPNSNLL